MWKYIVTYIIVISGWGPCPEPPIKYDEFGREMPHRLYLTSELCFTSDTSYKEKTFNTRKEATDFIKRGQDKKSQGVNPALFAGGELSNFKLDSIPSKQYNCTHPETSTTMAYCDPPDPNCNKTICYKCGTQWPSY